MALPSVLLDQPQHVFLPFLTTFQLVLPPYAFYLNKSATALTLRIRTPTHIHYMHQRIRSPQIIQEPIP